MSVMYGNTRSEGSKIIGTKDTDGEAVVVAQIDPDIILDIEDAIKSGVENDIFPPRMRLVYIGFGRYPKMGMGGWIFYITISTREGVLTESGLFREDPVFDVFTSLLKRFVENDLMHW